MPQRPPKACRQTNCKNTVSTRKYQGYCEQHKDKAGWFANEKRKGNRHKRGYGNDWEKLRAVVLKRDKGLCQHCLTDGIIKPGNQVDHIKPIAHGGGNWESNLQTLCNYHHRQKTSTERMGGAG